MASVSWADAADLGFLRERVSWSEEVLARKLAGREVAVALEGERRIGYLVLDHLWTVVPFVATIWVEPGSRRRGVGRALLELLEGEVRARGQAFYYSSSQLDEPEPQAWHRKMGFEECGILAGHNEGGVGEVVFRKRVAP